VPATRTGLGVAARGIDAPNDPRSRRPGLVATTTPQPSFRPLDKDPLTLVIMGIWSFQVRHLHDHVILYMHAMNRVP